MPAYRLAVSNQAQRVLARMAQREPARYRRVAGVIDDLARDPHRGKPLKGPLAGRWSLRVGSYRILYLLRAHELLVLIIDVGHRRDIYR